MQPSPPLYERDAINRILARANRALRALQRLGMTATDEAALQAVMDRAAELAYQMEMETVMETFRDVLTEFSIGDHIEYEVTVDDILFEVGERLRRGRHKRAAAEC